MEKTESVDSDDSCSELSSFLQPQRPKLAPIASCETLFDSDQPDGMDVPAITMDETTHTGITLSDFSTGESSSDVCDDTAGEGKLHPTSANVMTPSSSSSEVVLGSSSAASPNALSSAASSDTLTPGTPRVSPLPSPVEGHKKQMSRHADSGQSTPKKRASTPNTKMAETSSTMDALALSPTTSPVRLLHLLSSPGRPSSSPVKSLSPRTPSPIRRVSSPAKVTTTRSPTTSPKLRRAPSPISYSYSSPNMVTPQIKIRPCE